MAIVFIEQQKTQRILIFVFLLVLLVIGYVVWQGFFKKTEEVPPEETQISLPAREEVKIDFSVLSNPILEKLQPFLEIQPFKETALTEKLGRENPFIPY